ncbi:hypothetical protein [Sphingomonas nostoxanthinifaciens]|uniref:hypothetical protein n=1 Tax=Sphingomonas nostoxanthinifaciens TaxID=2872652 RepID=UPI001CC215CF|nr:hypothetical protein [Sphingomonas nostoxanthinifaciens]UAK24533.1 hypothetical protein K8P63_19885 [Sphingomonas nostoxanthinifaciens]
MIETPQLSRLEWSAVAIALKDAGRSGCDSEAARPGLIARSAAALFGLRRANPLADDRLEAVRHFVCASRRRRATATDLAPSLAAQGFNAAQIDALALLSL